MKREEELEIVTTAYFLEERIYELKNDQHERIKKNRKKKG